MKSKEEIEQLAERYADGYSTEEAHTSYIAFQDGYTKCQEDNADKKYTEEDIREAIDMARQLSHVSCLEDGEHRLKYSNTEDDIINSLNKQDNE
jgi:spore coat polysaccharide biosynthesis protein SpsF (cytidylyltransferase family)